MSPLVSPLPCHAVIPAPAPHLHQRQHDSHDSSVAVCHRSLSEAAVGITLLSEAAIGDPSLSEAGCQERLYIIVNII